MNKTDKEMLERDYHHAKAASERAFEDSVTELQDDAYNMGFERGCGAFNRLILALEHASSQLLVAGFQAQSEEIDKLIDEVTE